MKVMIFQQSDVTSKLRVAAQQKNDEYRQSYLQYKSHILELLRIKKQSAGNESLIANHTGNQFKSNS